VNTTVLTNENLTGADESLLQMLADGRVTAPYAADELDLSQEYVRSRLKRFVEHGHARKVYAGLYELTDDPRESDDAE